MQKKPTLIIGLGNPILGDDGVGWVIAQKLKDDFGDNPLFEFDFLSLGGLSLMERLSGYHKVILIDSFSSGNAPVGQVYELKLDDCPDLTSGHSASAHDTSLKNALAVGRSMEIPLPKDEDVFIFAVEAINLYQFTTDLSQEIRSVVPLVVERIKRHLEIQGAM